MAATTIARYSDEVTLNLPPLYHPLLPDRSHGRVRCATFTFTAAADVVASFAVACIPPNARILSGLIVASATLSNSAQVSVGLAAKDGTGIIQTLVGIAGRRTTANAAIAADESDGVALLKAAAVLSTTQVPFAITQALGYLYRTTKETWLTLTSSVGTLGTEIITGHVFYVVD